MLPGQQYAPAPIHSLVNHLDATLAACQELVKLQSTAGDHHLLLRLELAAIAHVLQARHDMQECAFEDRAVASQIVLFLAVTDCFEDARASAGKPKAEADHLIGGRIPAATLMALAAAMRDVLGVCYQFSEGAAEAEPSCVPSPIPEAMVWATAPDGV